MLQTTDYAVRFVRHGLLTRKEAVQLVKERDHKLDPKCVEDFILFAGYTETEFWNIIESFYNKDLFYKNVYGEWVLINPIWNEKK